MKTNIKRNRYQRIYLQLEELLKKSDDITSNKASIIAMLHHKFDYFFWTGFYNLVDGELTVGPYQGAIACIKLKKDTGVCWAAINKKSSILVADVEEFDGHIACDPSTKSELVVPVKNQSGEIVCVLDVDSKDLNSFDQEDVIGLEKIVQLIYK